MNASKSEGPLILKVSKKASGLATKKMGALIIDMLCVSIFEIAY